MRQVSGLVKAVYGVSAAPLQFEALRTSTPEARASDHQFLASLSLARDSCVARGDVGCGLSAEETRLLDVTSSGCDRRRS